ncbi:MAG: 16S rRNA (uracil(1498)-N(3))-methyltransferase [Muribaculaceae bacterium]|nr:16S rRNA (uracil(1498)-N(3))-methyltransferase [Muribaculaceae bacterium]
MIIFYAPDILQTHTLPESDSGHCVRVLRMTEGSQLDVIDGCGHRYHCVLTQAHPRHATVEIIDCIDAPLPWAQHITVAVAPTKHMDRMEWMVEKLTEIGVNRIVPLLCRRSERKEIKVERLQKIAVAAMKQSLKSVLPEIMPMTPVSKVIADYSDRMRFVAYCDQSIERHLLARCYKPGQSAVVMIGPEGDFDSTEITSALDAGWQPVTLGDNRLRTETAAIFACSTLHIVNQLSSI